MVSVRREGGGRPFDYMARLQTALAPSRLESATSDRLYGLWPVVLTATDADYERYGRTPGRLTATVHVFLYQSRLVGSIPLVEGARGQTGSLSVELRRVLKRPDGCSVLIRQRVIESFGRQGVPASYQFVLRNASRREAVLGDSTFPAGHDLQLGNWSIGPAVTSSLAFHDVIQQYPQRLPQSATSLRIDAAWLDGADLAVIETAYTGGVTRSLTVDGFRMRR